MTLLRTANPEPGQRLRLSQKLRRATCAEVECELYLNGKLLAQCDVAPSSPVARAKSTRHYDAATRVAYIHHPAGAECGPRCPNEYCPCVSVGGMPGVGGYPHHVQDEEAGLRFGAADGRAPVRPASESEFLDRMGEGVEMTRHIRQRGV